MIAGAPGAVADKRAEVAKITADLQAIDHRVEDAAEAYNGARYRLSEATDRVARNRRAVARTTRSLTDKRAVLAKRLRGLYVSPEPSLAQVLVTSGSLTAAADHLALLEQIGHSDARLVGDLRKDRDRLAGLREGLISDREASRRDVGEAERQTRAVEALLARRQAVLESARGDLGRLLAAEQARERREAAERAEIARRRQTLNAAAAAPSAPAATAVAPTPVAPEPVPANPAPSAPAEPLPSGSGNAAAATVAMKYLGVPYKWGGASPSTGFDCSGLASYAYAQIGKSVPHYTVAIWNAFPKVPAGQLQVGDLVFYRGLGHMGIYIGGGQYVNAPQTGDFVKVSGMASRSDYVGAVRP